MLTDYVNMEHMKNANFNNLFDNQSEIESFKSKKSFSTHLADKIKKNSL